MEESHDSLDFSMSQKDFPLMATPARSPKQQQPLALGQAVEASYKGKGTFYPGKIARAHGDGAYDVDYDDGEKEEAVKADLIRVPDTSPIAVGDAVECRYKAKGKYYPGKVVRAHGDGTFDIHYDDGELESAVARALIRKAPPPPADVLSVGTAVEARYRGKGAFYPGNVAAVNAADGTYSIDYDDGEQESGVTRALIRVTGAVPAAAAAAAPAGGDLAVGTKVECRYKGKSKFYPGKVAAVANGTFSIDYDDGEQESGVARALIRVLEAAPAAAAAAPTAAAPTTADDLAVGTKVECRYKGKSKFYPGKVAGVANGTYSIDYDDGEQESGVARALIRVLEAAPAAVAAAPTAAAPTTADDLAVGTKVECRYKGKSKFYPGKVAGVANGTYSIDYEDGEQESGVARALIRVLEAAPPAAAAAPPATAVAPTTADDLAVGTVVECRYKAKSKYYKGKVAAVANGTYSIDYDDGEQESGVARALIRVLEAAPAAVAAAPTAAAPTTADDLAVGTKVECRYKGKSKFYPGKVAGVANGTYSIDYDDGEQESGVARALIRVLEAAAAAAPTAAAAATYKADDLAVGTVIEARFKGKSKYYRGKIAAVANGTYSIDYDDGEEETGVVRDLIRVVEEEAAAAGPVEVFGVGDVVEARFKGKSKYYAGMIATVHGDDDDDGTYAIEYDDGEYEGRVAAPLIRLVKRAAPAGRAPAGSDDDEDDDDDDDDDDDAGLLKAAAMLPRTRTPFKEEEKEGEEEPVMVPVAAATPVIGNKAKKVTSALMAAASKMKEKDDLASLEVAAALAAAAVEVRATADAHAAVGLEAAARDVDAAARADARLDLEDAAREQQRSVAEALRLASAEVDGLTGADAAALLGIAEAKDERRDVSNEMPWAEGYSSNVARLAHRTMAHDRINFNININIPAGGRPTAMGGAKVPRLQRIMLSRSVDFGSRRKMTQEEREETFKRLTSDPVKPRAAGRKGAHSARGGRLKKYGSYGDAANCTFQPRIRADPNSEAKKGSDADDDGASDDGEAKALNFVNRQDAWNNKVRNAKEFAIGKKAYDTRLNNKICPKCGAVQAYDEFVEKRLKCVNCGVDYVKPKQVDLADFLVKQEKIRAAQERRQAKLERDAARRSKGSITKRVLQNGRVVEVPLFGPATQYGWDSFADRMERDADHRRRKTTHNRLTSEEFDDAYNGTYQPHIFTKKNRPCPQCGGNRACDHTVPDIGEPKTFDGRLDADVRRRQAKTERWLAEDRECKKWFQRSHGALREVKF